MWMMLQQDEADDFVISSGKTHSVREFVKIAFECVNLDYTKFVKKDLRFVRPAEVDLLVGNSTKAHKKLGWSPTVSFKSLVEMMVQSDLNRLRKI